VWVAEYVSASHVEQPVSAQPQGLIVAPESLDFGSIWETNSFAWNVVFENKGDGPVTVSAVRGGCDCTKVAWDKEATLQAGERVTVPITVDLLQVRSYDWSETRSAEVVVYATTESEGRNSSTDGWVLHGNIRRLMSCEPSEIGLGEQLIAGIPGTRLDFKIGLNGPANAIRLKKTPDEWSVALKRIETRPPSYVLQATPCKLKSGLFSDEFKLEITTENGRVMPTQSLRVTGRVRGDIDIYPRNVDLGVGAIGTKVRASIWVRGHGEIPISVVQPAATDPLLRFLRIQKEVGGWRIDVERVIDAAGWNDSSGVIHIEPGARKSVFLVRWYGTSN
jgi:hypothetical protein